VAISTGAITNNNDPDPPLAHLMRFDASGRAYQRFGRGVISPGARRGDDLRICVTEDGLITHAQNDREKRSVLEASRSRRPYYWRPWHVPIAPRQSSSTTETLMSLEGTQAARQADLSITSRLVERRRDEAWHERYESGPCARRLVTACGGAAQRS